MSLKASLKHFTVTSKCQKYVNKLTEFVPKLSQILEELLGNTDHSFSNQLSSTGYYTCNTKLSLTLSKSVPEICKIMKTYFYTYILQIKVHVYTHNRNLIKDWIKTDLKF